VKRMEEKTEQIGKKGFRLLKFFAYASFGVLLVFTFPFSTIISRNAKQLLLQSYENYALLIGQNLDYQIFQNFSLPVVAKYGQIRLRDEEQYQLMDKVVKNTIHGFKIDMVNIYDINKGIIAYSTNPTLVGKKVILGEGYKAATLGNYSSKLIKQGGDIWGVGLIIPSHETKLRTFLPFKGVDPLSGGQTYIMGVFELLQDVTSEYNEMKKFQYVVFAISISIMALIFVSLLLVVRKAEAILEQRSNEQREWEAKLSQAERLATLGRMVAVISHEIKNPLGVISSTTELLQHTQTSPEDLKQLLGIILEESRRLNGILVEFLDFARPKTPELKVFDMRDTISQVLVSLDQEMKKQHVKVVKELSDIPVLVKADENQIYRALFNIFINSLQALDGEGQIGVKISLKDGSWEILIEDNGKGIAPEDVKKVFEPFFTTKRKGSGLGLAIVKNIIDAHKGFVAIESQPGFGTKVKISLPAYMGE